MNPPLTPLAHRLEQINQTIKQNRRGRFILPRRFVFSDPLPGLRNRARVHSRTPITGDRRRRSLLPDLEGAEGINTAMHALINLYIDERPPGWLGWCKVWG